MTTADNKTTDVAVLDQFPEKIDDIKKAIENLVVTESKVTELKTKYEGVTIADENDEEGYKLAREAKSILVKTRTLSEDDRKVALKPIDDLRDNVHNRFMSVQAELKKIEAPISSRIKEIDDIEKQKKEQEKLDAENKINARINELVAKGMVFMDGYYVISAPELGISPSSIGVVDIRTMSDELYASFLEVVTEKSTKINAEKERIAAEEKKKKEAQEAADKKEREEMAAAKKKLEDDLAALKKQQDDLAAQQKLIDDQKKQQEQDRISGIIRNRSAVLVSIGLEYNAQGESFDYKGEALVSDAAGIAEHDDNAWLQLVDNLKNTVAQKKKEAEEFIKKQQEEEQKKQQQQEQERLAGLSDKQKMQEYMDKLLAIPAPPLKTKTWINKAGTVRDFLTDNRPA